MFCQNKASSPTRLLAGRSVIAAAHRRLPRRSDHGARSLGPSPAPFCPMPTSSHAGPVVSSSWFILRWRCSARRARRAHRARRARRRSPRRRRACLAGRVRFWDEVRSVEQYLFRGPEKKTSTCGGSSSTPQRTGLRSRPTGHHRIWAHKRPGAREERRSTQIYQGRQASGPPPRSANRPHCADISACWPAARLAGPVISAPTCLLHRIDRSCSVAA